MKIGVIGGSGLYDIQGLEGCEERTVDTPFGAPSDAFICGTFEGRDVFFLPRHARGHKILPSEINYRANVYALKTLGADCVLSVSAVGSLREELRPRDVVLPDQYFDRTKSSRDHTFFGDGLAAHVAFGEPTCPALRAILVDAVRDAAGAREETRAISVTSGGTYVNMEGPAFSTKAESHAYRHLGCTIIGMTSLREAKLCREAEICYQPICMVTDYDCWREAEEAVTVEMIVQHLMANTELAREILRLAIPRIPTTRDCACSRALADALITRREAVPVETRKKLAPIVGKYL